MKISNPYEEGSAQALTWNQAYRGGRADAQHEAMDAVMNQFILFWQEHGGGNAVMSLTQLSDLRTRVDEAFDQANKAAKTLADLSDALADIESIPR